MAARSGGLGRCAASWSLVGAVALALGCGPGHGPPAGDVAGSTSSGTGATGGDAASATSTTGSTDPPPEPIACVPTPGFEGEESTCLLEPWEVPPESWVRCDGPESPCLSVTCEEQHCGACGHACPDASGCFGGVCGSFGSPCVTPEDGFETCAEVCAAFGYECEDRSHDGSDHPGCERGYVPGLADKWTGAPGCWRNFNASTTVEAGCTEAFTWDHGTEEQPQTSVSCCCKGDV